MNSPTSTSTPIRRRPRTVIAIGAVIGAIIVAAIVAFFVQQPGANTPSPSRVARDFDAAATPAANSSRPPLGVNDPLPSGSTGTGNSDPNAISPTPEPSNGANGGGDDDEEFAAITVVGRVVDIHGSPIAGVQVQAVRRSPVTTDADGRFEVVVPDDLVAEGRLDGFIALDAKVNSPAGEAVVLTRRVPFAEVRESVEIVAPVWGTALRIRIHGLTPEVLGSSLPDLSVRRDPTHGRVPHLLTATPLDDTLSTVMRDKHETDAAGTTVTFEYPLAGRYFLGFWLPPFLPVATEIFVAANTITDIDIFLEPGCTLRGRLLFPNQPTRGGNGDDENDGDGENGDDDALERQLEWTLRLEPLDAAAQLNEYDRYREIGTDGRFEWRGVAPGKYRLYVQRAYHALWARLGKPMEFETDIFEIDVVPPETVVELLVSPVAAVVGELLDAEGNVVPFAELDFAWVGGEKWFAEIVPVRNGKFQMMMPQGVYLVRATTDFGHLPPTVVEVSDGRPLSLRLQPSAEPGGTVRWADGTPVVHASVWLHGADLHFDPGTLLMWDPHAQTNVNGQFTAHSWLLGPGRLDVQAQNVETETRIFGQWAVTIGSPIDVVLGGTHTARGRIVLPDHFSEPNLELIALRLDEPTRDLRRFGVMHRLDDEKGEFEFTHLLPGRYALYVGDAFAREFVVPSSTDDEIIEWRYKPTVALRDLRGRLLGPDGKAVAHGRITVVIADLSATVPTDADGQFTLDGIPFGIGVRLAAETAAGRPLEPIWTVSGDGVNELAVMEFRATGFADGFRVVSLDPAGSAALAGVRPFDLITAVDGSVVRSSGDFLRAIRSAMLRHAPEVTLALRRDGRHFSVHAPWHTLGLLTSGPRPE